MSAGEVFYSYGLVLLTQEWNNGSFPQYMHSGDGLTDHHFHMDGHNEARRGCVIGGWREGVGWEWKEDDGGRNR